jgi:hypothetical protein
MSENNNVIHLPEFKEKKSKKVRDINLPVKNEILYGLKILSVNVKPRKVKIKGKKTIRYAIPIHLISMDVISQEAIDKIVMETPKENINYHNIKQFGADKNCFWNLARTHYDILKMWLIENNIGIGNIMYFNRIGFGVNSKLLFRTENQGKEFLKTLKEKKEKKESKK